jgi:valyl-tRNA synthetase
MRTRKVACPKCKGAFRPGGPWPADDPELPTAKQASERFDMGRNFANKLWNAARFLLLNLEGYSPAEVATADLPLEDRWILGRLQATAADVTGQLEEYHFSEALRTIYDFTWSEFCDWYVEMSKGRLREAQTRPQAHRVLACVLDGILRLVHPFMPFVTESIWQALGEAAGSRGLPLPTAAAESVCIAAWPCYPPSWHDEALQTRLRRMQDLVRLVREVRNRYMIDPRTSVEIRVRCAPVVSDDFRLLAPFIEQLAGVGALDCGPDIAKPPQAATRVHADFELYVSLLGLIDPTAESARLQKQQAEKQRALQGARGKLQNAGFLERAPAEVVQQVRDQAADLEAQLRVIEETLHDLQQGGHP